VGGGRFAKLSSLGRSKVSRDILLDILKQNYTSKSPEKAFFSEKCYVTRVSAGGDKKQFHQMSHG